ncbi:hypothetical protein T265_03752 [Opisthorchis viverrini]|uniref:Uncharacterized protein n=1 Tax=Opisthorchis viverrini TaxID=6198 RepID=A0A075AHC4_OPIVI|nr:hypothetical protein T265_03752 [Opisthorchis viverrini]KER29639.1 hypothetical protein T265_03752 [Opisthorchis viverrini]
MSGPCLQPLIWPESGSPSRKTAMNSAAEFASNGFHTSLPSLSLTASGSLPPFTWLGEKRSLRNSVDWHTRHVAKPAQPKRCDQFIYRGEHISSQQLHAELSSTYRVFSVKLQSAQITRNSDAESITFSATGCAAPSRRMFQSLRHSRYRSTCIFFNALLIRLLKIRRQPTTGFTLLGAHQVGAQMVDSAGFQKSNNARSNPVETTHGIHESSVLCVFSGSRQYRLGGCVKIFLKTINANWLDVYHIRGVRRLDNTCTQMA